ncbi:MAG: MBL fold metallo-hydrolase [Gemmatimonadaceae bacterium]|jgi:glyoxylase-like metal-dependent hydrolase (beta-lactamase superfamily II)|nr:MBL fold metallo-hydrolase [Gemmatimonadaceae bacterium]
MIDRRDALARLAAGAMAARFARTPGALADHGAHRDPDDRVGAPLVPWRPGMLDIHHLATGRGDATLVVAPDGRTALIDAGAVTSDSPALVAPQPDGARAPGEWIARHVQRRLRDTGARAMHSLVVTHLHADHAGGVPGPVPLDPARHVPTGASDVARRVPVETLLDGDWPDYAVADAEDRRTAANHAAFALERARNGQRNARLVAGTTGQVLPDAVVDGTPFTVRTLAARGHVWTGTGTARRDAFASRPAGDPPPTENAGSVALLIEYGAFRYAHFSDLTSWRDAGTRPWMDALTPAAAACGRVTVAVLPHHGMFDGADNTVVATLAARAWIISAWHAAHPSLDVLERLYTPRLFDGARDVWSTALHPAAALGMDRLVRRFVSRSGHVICRVPGASGVPRVVVTRSDDERDTVTSVRVLA